MLYGTARVTVFNPDGTIFIGDVAEGDLWFFPTGFPHSIQGLGPDGCEFLLVFDQGTFSEYNTFLISGWLAHTPSKVLSRNFTVPEAALADLPEQGLYIFPGTVPGALEDDRKAVGGAAVASTVNCTFRMKAMKPTAETAGGTIRIVDSTLFHTSKSEVSLNQWIRRLPVQMTEQHLRLSAATIAQIPNVGNNILAR
jgi:oxalate decarboxylase